MPYTAQKPQQASSSEELRSRIPGWGSDLDPADRPSVPRERTDLVSGAHWDFPDRQPGGAARERSIEHAGVPPVFGTAAPLKGLSGVIRRYAYDHYSEARAAHWLLLLAGDRVDVIESHLTSLGTRHPVNPLAKSGLRAEFTGNGWASRVGKGRADLRHQWMDPLVAFAPWLALGGVTVAIVRAVRGRR
jgi:hypothetical protein